MKQLKNKDGLEVVLEEETESQLKFVIRKSSEELDRYEDSTLYRLPIEKRMRFDDETIENFKSKYFIYLEADMPILQEVFTRWAPPNRQFVKHIQTNFYELILNALVHGNRYDTEKSIHVTATRFTNPEEFPTKEMGLEVEMPALLEITVRDEGEGFDWRNVMERLKNGQLVGTGRSDSGGDGIRCCWNSGIPLRWNEKGNEVKAYFGYF